MADLGLLISAADLAPTLEPGDAAALDAGTLDGGDVWYEYRTQEDDRVRPYHAALNGTVWRVGDPAAPVPPIDYGCRCFISYVARPGSAAAKVLPEATREPAPVPLVLGDYLDETAPGWRKDLAAFEGLPAGDRLGALTLRFQSATGLGRADARDLASMALQVGAPSIGMEPPPAPPVAPSPIGPAPAPSAPVPVLAAAAAPGATASAAPSAPRSSADAVPTVAPGGVFSGVGDVIRAVTVAAAARSEDERRRRRDNGRP